MQYIYFHYDKKNFIGNYVNCRVDFCLFMQEAF